jgi:hypothetical protein
MTSRLRTLLPAALLVAGPLLGAPAPAAAQSLGVEGGVTWSQYKFETPALATENLLGGTGGVFAVLSEGPFAGQIEALWTRKGMKTAGGSEVRVDYLEIPVGTRLIFSANESRNVHVMFGGTLAFKLAASQSGTPVFEVLDEDVDALDLGLFVGGGVEYGALVANARYVWGVRDISDRPIEAYNRGFSFMVGVKLLGR